MTQPENFREWFKIHYGDNLAEYIKNSDKGPVVDKIMDYLGTDKINFYNNKKIAENIYFWLRQYFFYGVKYESSNNF